MVKIHTLEIDPPLLNSSCLWASDEKQLSDLYDSPYTGAVTVRTATLHGYKEDYTNAVVFSTDRLSTLNSYGYSPHPLSTYIDWIYALLTQPAPHLPRATRKPIILSVTASHPADLHQMLKDIQHLRERLRASSTLHKLPSDAATLLAIELNTSCPNIPGAPPPSYDLPALRPLLAVLAEFACADPSLTLGLKLPPYPDFARVRDVVGCLAEYTVGTETDARSAFAFVTCTNTLGGSMFFMDQISPVDVPDGSADPAAHALPTGFGGLGGAQMHAIALGTVRAVASAIAEAPSPAVRGVKVIGVGGVTDCAAARRMRAAGACAVACATLLGRLGVRAFEVLSEDAPSADL